MKTALKLSWTGLLIVVGSLSVIAMGQDKVEPQRIGLWNGRASLGEGKVQETARPKQLQPIQEGTASGSLVSSVSCKKRMVEWPIRATMMVISAAGGMCKILSELVRIITKMDLISTCSSQQGRVPPVVHQIEH